MYTVSGRQRETLSDPLSDHAEWMQIFGVSAGQALSEAAYVADSDLYDEPRLLEINQHVIRSGLLFMTAKKRKE